MSNSAFTPTVLTVAASGSGTGELNVVTNPSAVSNLTGWTATGLTASQLSSGSPLDPVIPTGFQLTASAIGQTYAASSLAVPAALRNKKLKLEFSMSMATAAFKVDVLNSSGTRFNLTTDSSGATNLPALSSSGKFVTYFDMDSGSTISVQFTSILASGTLSFTNVIVGPGIQPQGAVVGEWQSYTPVLKTDGGTQPSLGSTGTATGRWRRVGSSIEIDTYFNFSGTGINYGAGDYYIDLVPLGLTLNAAAMPGTGGTDGSLTRGVGYVVTNATATRFTLTSDVGIAANANRIFWLIANGTAIVGSNMSGTASVFAAGGMFPVAEWAGSGTVQLAQNDVEYAWNSSTSTTATDTTSFGYGPGGATIQSISAALRRRVQFNTPIQAGDKIDIEIQPSTSSTWINLSNIPADSALTNTITPQINLNGALYGLASAQVNGSNTQIDVYFSQYPSPSGATTFGGAAFSWSAGTNPPSNWKWRVRKSSAGAAVGFGIVVPGTSSGLVSSAGLPGNTTGNAIASGYVGEVRTFTSRIVTTSTTGTWASNATPIDTLPAGTWLICGSQTVPSTSGLSAAAGGIGIAANTSGPEIGGQNWLGYNPSASAYDIRGQSSFVISVGPAGQPLYAKAVTLGTIGAIVTVYGTAVRIA